MVTKSNSKGVAAVVRDINTVNSFSQYIQYVDTWQSKPKDWAVKKKDLELRVTGLQQSFQASQQSLTSTDAWSKNATRLWMDLSKVWLDNGGTVKKGSDLYTSLNSILKKGDATAQEIEYASRASTEAFVMKNYDELKPYLNKEHKKLIAGAPGRRALGYQMGDYTNPAYNAAWNSLEERLRQLYLAGNLPQGAAAANNLAGSTFGMAPPARAVSQQGQPPVLAQKPAAKARAAAPTAVKTAAAPQPITAAATPAVAAAKNQPKKSSFGWMKWIIPVAAFSGAFSLYNMYEHSKQEPVHHPTPHIQNIVAGIGHELAARHDAGVANKIDLQQKSPLLQAAQQKPVQQAPPANAYTPQSTAPQPAYQQGPGPAQVVAVYTPPVVVEQVYVAPRPVNEVFVVVGVPHMGEALRFVGQGGHFAPRREEPHRR